MKPSSSPGLTKTIAADSRSGLGIHSRRRGLFRKYVLSLVGLVTLVLVVSGLMDVWFAYGEVRQAAFRVQQEKSEAAAQRITQFVTDIERQIGWTTHPQWAAGGVEQRRFDYIRLLRQVPAITEIMQLDADGREQLKVSRLAMDVVGSNADWSQDPRFIEAKASRLWFSPVYFRKESEPYISFAVAQSGRNTGVTIAEVNLKLIWDVITAIKVGRTGYAYVVDGEGRLIAHPDISLVLRKTDLSHLPQVAAAHEGKPAQRSDGATLVTNFEGQKVISAHAPIAQLGWLVFVELPVAEAVEPLVGSALRTGALLLAGLVLASGAGLLLARRMVLPIRVLETGAARIRRRPTRPSHHGQHRRRTRSTCGQLQSNGGAARGILCRAGAEGRRPHTRACCRAGGPDRDRRGSQGHQSLDLGPRAGAAHGVGNCRAAVPRRYGGHLPLRERGHALRRRLRGQSIGIRRHRPGERRSRPGPAHSSGGSRTN